VSRRSIDLRLGRFTRRLRVYFGSAYVAVDVLSVLKGRRLRGVRESVGAGSDFDAAMGALARALDAMASAGGDLRGLTCDVVIADRWLLYEVVAVDVTQVPRQAASAAVAATMADVSGTRADALEVSWQWQRDGRSVLAMGIQRARLVQLRAVLERGGLAIRSVKGEFVAVLNDQRPNLGAKRVVLAVSRDGGAQVALLSEGEIRSIGFEVDCRNGAALVRAATNVMRMRGDDTTAEVDYVIDPGEPPEDRREHEHYDDAMTASPDHWRRVRTPEWAAAAV